MGKLTTVEFYGTKTYGWIVVCFIGLFLSVSAFAFGNAQDNDMWWMIATGREIAENGILFQNPFDVYGDQDIVVQQWGYSLIIYFLYSHFGWFGICAFVSLEVIILSILYLGFYKLYANEKKYGIQLICSMLLAGIALTGSFAYMSGRPHLVSMIIIMTIILIMESYRSGRIGSKQMIITLVIVSLIHSNLHAATIVFDVIIVLAYAIPSVHCSLFSTVNDIYKRLPVWISLLIMCIAFCINPYGVDAMFYTFNSVGAASYSSSIAEMQPTNFFSGYGMVAIFWIVCALLTASQTYIDSRKIDAPLVIIVVLFSIFASCAVRNIWLISIAGYIYLMSYINNMRNTSFIPPRRSNNLSLLLACASASFCVCMSLFIGMQNFQSTPHDSSTTPVSAINYIENYADYNSIDKKNIKVLTTFNSGGYFEFFGYKVSMDPRPELWNNSITNSGHDRYKEYLDTLNGKFNVAQYVDDTNCDFVYATTDSEIYKYCYSSNVYEKVLENDNYILFTKKN